MSTIINATTTNGVVIQPDNSGSLVLQTNNGTTALTISTAQNTTFAGTVTLPTGTVYPIVSATAVASTSGTSIDFTSIPSWVKRITVMLNGVSTNGTSNILVRLGNSGGIVSSGYVSQASIFSVGTRSTTGFILTQEMTSAGLLYGQYICNLQNSATNAWTGCGVLDKNDNNHPFSGGALTSMASAITTVRITTVNGTDAFDAGSINILYE
jgi:hypothetical protein